jgi:hypothetical protein
MKPLLLGMLIGLLLILAGCASTAQPARTDNLCKIFQEKSSWYSAAKDAQEKWGTPIHVMMAIMHQESRFRHDAQPPRPWFLFIPLPRRSSAYGYAQAQDGTWDMYLKDVSGWFQSREDFDDSIDFIGWYTNKSREKNGVSLWHTDKQYLNYHEGWGGYRRGSYKKKPWLMKVAKRVKWRAGEYGEQLKRCDL